MCVNMIIVVCSAEQGQRMQHKEVLMLFGFKRSVCTERSIS